MRIIINNEIKKLLNHTTFTLIFNNEDYLIDIKEISESELLGYIPYKIIFPKHANIAVKMYGFDKEIILTGLFTNLEQHNGLTICLIKIPLHLFKELWDIIQEIKTLKQKQNMRKEERILCDEKAFAILRLQAKAHILTETAFFYGVIQNLSYSAISLLYDTINTRFIENTAFIKLLFDSKENLLLKAKIIRQVENPVKLNYSELVMKIDDNIAYHNLISSYFKNHKLRGSKTF